MTVQSVLVALCLLGQEAPPENHDEPVQTEYEEAVEVRAALPESGDVAAFATTIDAEQIVQRGEDLADVLRRVPGAHVRDYGGLGSYANVSVRASTAEQVTVLVDGVPQNRALGGPVDLSSIPATQIEQITVYRGFGPASFGLGGIGGVIDVRTRAAGDEPEAQIDLLGGGLETARLSGNVSFRQGDTGSLRIGVEWLSSEGDFVYLNSKGTYHTTDDDEQQRRTNNDVEQQALFVQQVWDSVGGGQLRAGLRVQRRDRGVPGIDTLPSETGRLDQELGELNSSWTWRDPTSNRGLDLQFDVFRQTSDFFSLDGVSGETDQTTQITGAGTSGIFRVSPGRHQLLVRVDVRREEARVDERVQQTVGGANRDLLAVTAEDTLLLGRFVLSPSLRWQYRHDDFERGDGGGLTDAAEDVREGDWSGKIGAAYRLGVSTTIRGTVGRFHRIPNMLELFGDRGSVVGNPLLRPEVGDAAELGISMSRSKPAGSLNLEIAGFARRTQDLILLQEKSQGVSKPFNVLESEVVGLEASMSLRWPAGWSLDASGTLQDAVDTSGGFSDGRRLPYMPRTLAYLGGAFDHRNFQARWEVTYVGENSTDPLDTPVLRISSRVVHDALLSYKAPRGFKLGIDVRNVFDRQTRDLSRYPLPDRVVFLHFGWHSGASGS